MDDTWWKRGAIYQIYPRSFSDSNGDGVGDLKGIADRLDYCADLGVDAIWLSPFFPSPMADFGYDVADYTGVAPLFGSMHDFDELLAKTNARGLKLILDFVPNHTSSQHPWFLASRSHRASPQRDWYLWRDAAPGGGPPNNWLSNFGGSAWTWDVASGQYYYHSFLPEQPDLNWRNTDVVGAMHEVLRFWLKKGVAGFRIDVLWMLIKDDRWRDNPANPDYELGAPLFQSQLPLYTTDRPEVQDIVAGLRRVTDEFDARVLIGEIYLPLHKLVAYYGRSQDGVQMPFNFRLLQCPWDAQSIAALIDEYESLLPPGGWPNWVLGNHDNPRIATRVGTAQARVAAMLLLTLRGTPTLYYGDELGMKNVAIPAALVRDPLERNVPGKGLGRDPCRTPMQWDATRWAGFTSSTPWLPVSDDFTLNNVHAENADRGSLLTLYRRLLALRRAHPALSLGSYTSMAPAGTVLSYTRRLHEDRILVVLNLSAISTRYALPAVTAETLLSTHLDREGSIQSTTFELRPHEGRVFRINAPAAF